MATFTALRHKNYRLYWSGLLVAVIGWQILTFTQLWLIYQLTNSALYLGAAGGVNGAANICFSIFGGVIADRIDRRKLLIYTQFSMAILSFALGTLTATHLVNAWHILIITGLTGATSAFDSPARQALVPQLIEDPRDLNNAVALSSGVWSSARIVGPAIAGVFIAIASPALCFYATSAAYGTMIHSLTRIHVSPSQSQGKPQRILSDLKEGYRYVFHNEIFSILIGMTFLNSIFGLSYEFLLPIFSRDILAIGASGYGFLMAATGTGAVIGILVVASTAKNTHRGRLLLIGNSAFSVFLLLFSFSRWYELSLIVIFFAGFFNSLYMTNVLTLLQSLVPDRLRGRVMGIYSITWSLMPLGGMQAGFVANAFNAPIAVCIGAVIVFGFAIFVIASKSQISSLR